MARMRSIKPEFWSDRKISRLSRDARLLYISLWNFSDEHGRLQGDARYIKGHCLPYEDDLSLDSIDGLMNELKDAGRVEIYDVDGDPYLFLPRLARHQRLEAQKQESRLPAPPPKRTRKAKITLNSEESTDKSADHADKPEESPNESGQIVAQQVAGSRLHVAGKPSSPMEPTRIDVEQICAAVADHVEQVTRRRPKITDGWKRDARLLLDSDGRALSEVLAVISWVSADSFWSTNVLAVPTLRKQFGKLWAKSQAKTEAVPEWKRLGRLGEWDV